MKKVILSVCALSLSMFAQDMKENPIAAVSATYYKAVSTNITKAIDKMPADKFSFKSVDGTMPFSEFIGHLTDANQNFCTAVTGGTKPASIRKETSKEVLAKAWGEAVAECTKAWGMTTDKSLAATIKVGTREVPAAQPMMLNLIHSWEHYGNLVTLLRMNGLVPPSSEGR
jgi:uncharacterized damage-inducible protein DinB